jgi:hypothetical protein
VTCEPCAVAKVNALTGRVNAACKECSARSLAGSPQFRESIDAAAITPKYRARLQQAFGAEWKEAHSKVREWAERIAAAKHGKANP